MPGEHLDINDAPPNYYDVVKLEEPPPYQRAPAQVSEGQLYALRVVSRHQGQVELQNAFYQRKFMIGTTSFFGLSLACCGVVPVAWGIAADIPFALYGGIMFGAVCLTSTAVSACCSVRECRNVNALLNRLET